MLLVVDLNYSFLKWHTKAAYRKAYESSIFALKSNCDLPKVCRRLLRVFSLFYFFFFPCFKLRLIDLFSKGDKPDCRDHKWGTERIHRRTRKCEYREAEKCVRRRIIQEVHSDIKSWPWFNISSWVFMSFLSPVLNELLLKLIFGPDYEPTTLIGFLSSIRRYLNKQNYDFTIFTDAEFKTLMTSLKSKQMDLKAKWVGNKPMISDGLTDEEIEKLHASKCLGIKSPLLL